MPSTVRVLHDSHLVHVTLPGNTHTILLRHPFPKLKKYLVLCSSRSIRNSLAFLSGTLWFSYLELYGCLLQRFNSPHMASSPSVVSFIKSTQIQRTRVYSFSSRGHQLHHCRAPSSVLVTQITETSLSLDPGSLVTSALIWLTDCWMISP